MAFGRYLAASILVFLAVSGVSVSIASAEPVAVIVNPDNPIETMSVTDLKKFYSDIAMNWQGGEKVKIFDLPINDSARITFSKNILGKNPEDVTMEWANKRITNTAKNPPVTVKSQVLMQSKVASNKNALGYVSARKVKKGKVKVILTIK